MKKTLFYYLSIILLFTGLISCSDDNEPDNIPEGTPTKQEVQQKVEGYTWIFYDVKWRNGKGEVFDDIQLAGNWYPLRAFKIENNHFTEFLTIGPSGYFPYDENGEIIRYFRLTSSNEYNYDPRTGKLTYEIINYLGTKHDEREYILRLNEDDTLEFSWRFGCLPLGFSPDPDAVYDSKIKDPDSCEVLCFKRASEEEQQALYEKYTRTTPAASFH